MDLPPHTEDQAAIKIMGFSERIAYEENKGGWVNQQIHQNSFLGSTRHSQHRLFNIYWISSTAI